MDLECGKCKYIFCSWEVSYFKACNICQSFASYSIICHRLWCDILFQLVNLSLIARMANVKMKRNFLQIQLQMFIVLETKWCGRCYAFDAFCVSLFPQFQRFLILNSVDNRHGGIICCLVRWQIFMSHVPLHSYINQLISNEWRGLLHVVCWFLWLILFVSCLISEQKRGRGKLCSLFISWINEPSWQNGTRGKARFAQWPELPGVIKGRVLEG